MSYIGKSAEEKAIPELEERIADLTPAPAVIAQQLTALEEVALVKELKSATQDQAAQWVETNVKTLADVVTVLKIMARMLVALRNFHTKG